MMHNKNVHINVKELKQRSILTSMEFGNIFCSGASNRTNFGDLLFIFPLYNNKQWFYECYNNPVPNSYFLAMGRKQIMNFISNCLETAQKESVRVYFG
jgi:hypothetical protein